MEKVMVTGKLIRYDEIKGYGFIAPDDGSEDVFVHVNDVEMERSLLIPGIRVKFVIDEGDRGFKASRVSPVGSEEYSNHGARIGTQETFPAAGRTGLDDKMCDVLTHQELSHEITEALLAGVPALTASDLLKIRDVVLEVASSHQWLES
jgi:cold shock protein